MVDTKKPLSELAQKFIELMDSERGLQAKLAKSINKKAASFSAIRQGKPVNADHLKAVGIVCGAETLLALLSVDNKTPSNVIEINHIEIIKGFDDKESARNANLDLRDIEAIDKLRFREACSYLKGMADTLRAQDAESRPHRKNNTGGGISREKGEEQCRAGNATGTASPRGKNGR